MPTQKRAVRTRSAILEAAAMVFARRGYQAASFPELIAESGLTKGAFYFHFSSKQELALEVMRHKQSQLIGRIASEVPTEASALDRLAMLLRTRARALAEDESLWCVLRLGAELGGVSGPSSDYSRMNDWPIRVFTDLVGEGQEQGTIRPDLDPRATGEMIFASIIGMDSLSTQLTGGKDLTDRSEHLIDLLTAGLQRSEPHAKHQRRRSRR